MRTSILKLNEKPNKLFFIFIMVFFTSDILLQVSADSPWSYDIVPQCKENICIEGDPVDFEIYLHFDPDIFLNNLQSQSSSNRSISEYIRNVELIYSQIEIRDQQYNTLILKEKIDKKLNNQNTRVKFILYSTLPPPTQGNNLYYKPCFTRNIEYEELKCVAYNYFFECLRYDWVKESNELYNCGIDPLTLKVYPLSEIKCRKDGSCKFDEICSLDYKCRKFDCQSNQTYGDHTCKDLVCEENQVPLEHNCVNLNCKFLQKAKNHTCKLSYGPLLGIIFILSGGLILLYFKLKKRKYR